MTTASEHFGKRLDHFMASESTAEYLSALSELTGLAPRNSGSKVGGLPYNHRTTALVVAVPGNRYIPDRGTWAHPKLAVFFARWLDVRFAVWCDSMIEDIVKGIAEVVITKPEESAVMSLPKDLTITLVSGLTLPSKNVSLAECLNSRKENGNDENGKSAIHARIQARSSATGRGRSE
ncbi:KilA-N domain-containing protein, partial [Rhodoferax sp.]